MAEPTEGILKSFPQIVTDSRQDFLYLDANELVNFDKIGALDTLLLTGLRVIVVEEVFKEAVTTPLMTGDLAQQKSAERISDWFDAQEAAEQIEFRSASSENRELLLGPDAGEKAIAESIASHQTSPGNAVVLSDDGKVALKNLGNASEPVLTGQHYLSSLLLSGKISPNTYFSLSQSGAANGFSPKTFPGETSNRLDSGDSYQVLLPSGDAAVVQYNGLGVSILALSDGRVRRLLPWQTHDLSDPTGFRELPCFSVGTPILLADGTQRVIEDIVAGDTVAAFNENDSLGRAELRPATVARLLPGVTEEWIVLEDGTRVTPGHRYLTEHGTWATAADLIASDVRAVAADGSLVPLRGTLLRASDANSDAEWITPEPYVPGNAVVQPAPVFGWRTYNFEVAELHTYVAVNDNYLCERKLKVA